MLLMKKASDLRIPFSWDERRPIILDKFFYIPGFYEKHEDWTPVPWSDPQIFGKEGLVVIEYCSGNGQWICDRAKQNPSIFWVAVEKRFDRARKIWLRLHREEISNLFVVCGEAVVFSRHYVPKNSVSEIFVNFPDPWPKLRHAKHRVIRDEFLKEVEEILIPTGKAILTTDDFPYAELMMQTVSLRPNWRSLLPSPGYATDWPDYGASYFHDLWKQKGRTIYHMQFEVNK